MSMKLAEREALATKYPQLLPDHEEIRTRMTLLLKAFTPLRRIVLCFGVLCLISVGQFLFTGEILRFRWITILTFFLSYSLLLTTRISQNLFVISGVKFRETMNNFQYRAPNPQYGVYNDEKPDTSHVRLVGDKPTGEHAFRSRVLHRAAFLSIFLNAGLMLNGFYTNAWWTDIVAIIVGFLIIIAVKTKIAVEGGNVHLEEMKR